MRRSNERPNSPSAGTAVRSSSSSRWRSSCWVAFAGLSVDAGGSFAQRRDQQTAADLAALAAANDYLINTTRPWRHRGAGPSPPTNGFTHGTSGDTVDVDDRHRERCRGDRRHRAPHGTRSSGRSAWPTGRSRRRPTALAGFPDSGQGAVAVHLLDRRVQRRRHAQIPDDDRLRRDERRRPDEPDGHRLDELRHRQRRHSEVADIISGDHARSTRRSSYGEYIGQHNNGNHSTLFTRRRHVPERLDMPVAVVDHSGNFMGWAMFHVTSASGGSSKHIRGYFLSSFTSARMTIIELRRERLPALPRVVRPQADRLTVGGRARPRARRRGRTATSASRRRSRSCR